MQTTDPLSNDERVLSLLDNALGQLLTSDLVAIDIGVVKRRVSEWQRNARRYEVLTALSVDERQALFARSVGEGISVDALVDAAAERNPRVDPREAFLEQQGYWTDLVGPDSDDE